MKVIEVTDKQFTLYISAEVIQKKVTEIADNINKDFNNKNPLFLIVLNGSFIFASDLIKQINIDCEISFLKVSSYKGMEQGQEIKNIIGADEKISNRNIIIVEDIIDSGKTIQYLIKYLYEFSPKDIKIASLLTKQHTVLDNININYLGFTITNEFVVGYGLDYNGYGRNYPEIYKFYNKDNNKE